MARSTNGPSLSFQLALAVGLAAFLRSSKARNDCRHPLMIRGRLQSFEASIGCPMHAAALEDRLGSAPPAEELSAGG